MRKGIFQLAGIAIVFAVIVTLVAVLFQWLPTSDSEQFAPDPGQSHGFATIISIVIFSLVAALLPSGGASPI